MIQKNPSTLYNTAMHPSQRIVIVIPLSELWDDTGIISAESIQELSKREIRQLLRQTKLSFVIADVGVRLHWIPQAEIFEEWKAHIRDHTLNSLDETIDFSSYPEHCVYRASLWKTNVQDLIVLFEKYH